MNEEYRRGWITTSKLLLAVVIGTLWWLAGRGVDINRRFLLPVILTLGCIVYHFLQGNKKEAKWLWYCLMVPFYFVMMSIFSYGSGSWLRPLGVFLQRLIVGVAWSIPAVSVAWVNKTWRTYYFHIVVFTLTMIGAGFFAVALTAAAEECLIGFMWVLMVPFMIKWAE